MTNNDDRKFFMVNKVVTVILSVKLSWKVEKEKKQHRSNMMAISENRRGADDDSGLMQQRERGKSNLQWFPTVENEDSDR